MSLIILMYGHEPTMPFQMVDMMEVPTEAPINESEESVLEAVQAIPTISNYIHNKAVEKIMWALK